MAKIEENNSETNTQSKQKMYNPIGTMTIPVSILIQGGNWGNNLLLEATLDFGGTFEYALRIL